jgi:hypothetical protein
MDVQTFVGIPSHLNKSPKRGIIVGLGGFEPTPSYEPGERLKQFPTKEAEKIVSTIE